MCQGRVLRGTTLLWQTLAQTLSSAASDKAPACNAAAADALIGNLSARRLREELCILTHVSARSHRRLSESSERILFPLIACRSDYSTFRLELSSIFSKNFRESAYNFPAMCAGEDARSLSFADFLDIPFIAPYNGCIKWICVDGKSSRFRCAQEKSAAGCKRSHGGSVKDSPEHPHLRRGPRYRHRVEHARACSSRVAPRNLRPYIGTGSFLF